MDLHQLHVFRSAALSSCFTKASAELNISQSTVSQHIRNLEVELGCPLFLRVGRRVVLSPAGKLLLEHTEKIFRDVTNAEMAVRETNALGRGTLRLGTGASTLEYLLPPVLHAFSRRFPNVELLVTIGSTEPLVELMKNQKLDLAVIMLPVFQPGLRTISLGREELVVALPGEHPAARRGWLSTADLADLNFILYEKRTAMRNLIDGWFRDLGVEPRVRMEMDHSNSIKALVRAGLGASVLPACALSDRSPKDSVRGARLRKRPLFRELGLLVLDADPLPNATRELVALLSQALASA